MTDPNDPYEESLEKNLRPLYRSMSPETGLTREIRLARVLLVSAMRVKDDGLIGRWLIRLTKLVETQNRMGAPSSAAHEEALKLLRSEKLQQYHRHTQPLDPLNSDA